MALINLRNISVSYGGPVVLEKINLQIEKGERLCIIGRNGEGKSTLMKVVCGEVGGCDVGDCDVDTGVAAVTGLSSDRNAK